MRRTPNPRLMRQAATARCRRLCAAAEVTTPANGPMALAPRLVWRGQDLLTDVLRLSVRAAGELAMTSTDNILWNWGAVLLLVAGWYAFWLFGRNAARKLETARVATVPADGPPEALTLVRVVDPT